VLHGRDLEKVSNSADNLFGWAAFFGFDFAQCDDGTTNLVCELFAGQAFPHALTFQPFSEGQVGQQYLILYH
jgi:hypothetical protein